MINNIGIIEDQYNHILTFKFLNGEISMREDEYGGYAICPGCGAGKTTVVKELIDIRWYEGILYAAFTIDEVNSIYKYTVENLVGRSTNPHTGEVLKTEDILVLHSDYTADGTDNNLWRHNPQELTNKKVILCTHAKLLTEDLSLLMSTKFNSDLSNNIYPPLSRVMTGRGSVGDVVNLPRQWVIIDENPDAKSHVASIPRAALVNLGTFSNRKNIIHPRYGSISIQLDKPELVRKYNIYKDFSEDVDNYRAFLPEFKNLFKNDDCELNRIWNERMKESLYHKFRDLVSDAVDICKISSSFTDMLESLNEVKSHILILDGTADLTLYNSRKFTLYNLLGRKYNSDVNVFTFRFNINRSPKLDKSYNDPDKYIKDEFSNTIDDLESIIRQNNRTLIFCWKNLKPNSKIDEINDDKIADVTKVTVNSDYSIPEFLSKGLSEKGLTEGVNFSIEYYGSGRDKAINDYRDYDAVVLLGRYQVPNYVISEFNLMYNSNITSIDYYTNRVIQAICRSRIRLHNGLPINVYMSNDWSRDVIDRVNSYLSTGTIKTAISYDPSELEFRYNQLRGMKIPPKKAEQIVLLSTLDIQIYNSIITGNIYNSKIPLNDVFEILPMSRKEVDKYKKLISWIYKYGIKLDII